MKKEMSLSCVKCRAKPCVEGRLEALPSFCPMRHLEDLLKHVEELYRDSEAVKLAGAATRVALKGGYAWPRVREFAELAKELGAKKVGLAFCAGLSDEAEKIASLLEGWGFKVYSVCCKCGSLSGFFVKLDPSVILCNPIAQAELLNQAGTELNAIIGLCMGHDALFAKYSKAPAVTLIAKDRVTGHSPAVALYTYYHRRLLQPST